MPKLTDTNSVLMAIKEYDAIGRREYLTKYGFRKSKDYFLKYKGKYYDSKAIYGVAFGYENVELGPLKPSEFSGGEKTVQRGLERLGFSVVRKRRVLDGEFALVLVENEVTYEGRYDHWKDETGALYQYPNSYVNRVIPGRPFVYYRGVRRRSGRGQAEYFGFGEIGQTWLDPSLPDDTPKRNRKWFCEIEGYIPFPEPVPAKKNEYYYEKIGSSMQWRTAIREIPLSTFYEILTAAGVVHPDQTEAIEKKEITNTKIEIIDSRKSILRVNRSPKGGDQVHSGQFVTEKIKKEIGDRAEELVYQHLRSNLPERLSESVVWVAELGQTPGWDIEYYLDDGSRIAVEVKGTTKPYFTSIELTANEWQAAKKEGDNYQLALVSRALSSQPQCEFINNPYFRYQNGLYSVEATQWRLKLDPKANDQSA